MSGDIVVPSYKYNSFIYSGDFYYDEDFLFSFSSIFSVLGEIALYSLSYIAFDSSFLGDGDFYYYSTF
jgi:hypothetical protein